MPIKRFAISLIKYGALALGLALTAGISALTTTRVVLRSQEVKVPALVVEYTGDQTNFPAGIREIFDWIGSDKKEHIRVRGDHHGRPLAPDQEPGRAIAGRAIADWLKRHSFA